MKFAPVIMLALIILVAGCKKKTVVPVISPAFTTSQYFPPLKVGNYWAYQRIDTNLNRTYADTIKVVSDTIINAITYYSVMGGYYEGITDGYYGDSAGNIIMWPGGYAVPLSTKTNDTLVNVVEGTYPVIERTGNTDTTISVTAGAFNNSIQVITDVYYGAPNGPGHKYLYFSKGVGVSYATTFFIYTPNDIIAAQLVGYHISQ